MLGERFGSTAFFFRHHRKRSLGIAEALRGEWADTENLTVHLQADTCSKTPAVDTVRVIGINDISIAEDYKKWDGGLILSSSHETERLLRMNRPFVSAILQDLFMMKWQ